MWNLPKYHGYHGTMVFTTLHPVGNNARGVIMKSRINALHPVLLWTQRIFYQNKFWLFIFGLKFLNPVFLDKSFFKSSFCLAKIFLLLFLPNTFFGPKLLMCTQIFQTKSFFTFLSSSQTILYWRTTGWSAGTDKNFALIAWARKQPIS